jgi:hypothetical protein
MSNLRQRINRLELNKPRRVKRHTVFIYENDPFDRPRPTPEELADPTARIVCIEYLDHWPPNAPTGAKS